MTSVSTAKMLFFIALSLGPQSKPGTILATSISDNYVWEHGSEGWSLRTKGLPADEWTNRQVDAGSSSREQREFWVIAHHRWHGSATLDLEDGSQVLKQHGSVFYVQNPGAANQKVYTILYPTGQE